MYNKIFLYSVIYTTYSLVITRLNTSTKKNKIGERADYGGYEIKVIRNPEEIVNEISRQIEVSNKISVCTICNGGLQFSYNNFFIDLKRKALARGNSIRFVSELDRNNIDIAKMFIDGGIQLRHAKIRKLPPLSFSVTDKQIATTIDMMENGANFQSLIISDDPSYLNHFKKIFEQIWMNGIDARVRIADVEEGGESDDEIAEAKHYINEILEEINNMKNNVRERDGS